MRGKTVQQPVEEISAGLSPLHCIFSDEGGRAALSKNSAQPYHGLLKPHPCVSENYSGFRSTKNTEREDELNSLQ